MQQSERLQEADHELHRALEIAERLIKEHPSAPQYQSDAACTLGNLAFVAYQQRDPKASRDLLRRSLLFAKRAADAEPGNLRYRTLFMNGNENLATILMELKELDSAKELMRQVIVDSEKRVEDHPKVPDFRRELAQSFMNLGNIESKSGDRTGEEKHYQQALSTLEKLALEFPAVPGHHKDLSFCLAHLGELLISTGRPDDAVQLAEEAVTASPRESGCWQTLGVARYRAGNWKGAVEAFEKAKEIGQEKTLEPGAEFIRAMALWRLGERDRARESYTQAIANLEKEKTKDEKLLRLREEAAALMRSTGAIAPEPSGRNHLK
jgi:tetratricopeptide (TPR) repeat protein